MKLSEILLLFYCGSNAAVAIGTALLLYWWDRQDQKGYAGWKEVTSACR